MKNTQKLFMSFFKIGAFTFGGGYAMIALLENEFVEKNKQLSKEEFLDMVAIAESTPGPIAINSATYIGYKTDGFKGALISTIAVCLPSFIVIYLISLFLDDFLKLQYVSYAFKGINVCIIFLILSAGIKMFKEMEKDTFSLIILTAVILLMLFLTSIPSILLILISGLLGILI